MPDTPSIYKILKQYFGYDKFRSGQEELINNILAKRDALGVMPTGAGKSLCFQIPALMSSGVTLVVSPLISLMKDQVNALTQSGVAAAFINSSLTARQIEKVLQNAHDGVYKLIYVAPERLPAPDFLSFAQRAKIAMLTVDEAHCISQWGQDFRPSYAKIPEFINELTTRPVVSAFTATATPKVREDIIKLLRLNEPRVLITGFDRQNLFFSVQRARKKYPALLSFLNENKNRSGIIYCSTRKHVEQVCEQLQKDGFAASRYHAGLTDAERRGNQDDFIYDRIQIMVATNAFGMGIDKSNVSFVTHYNMPKDIESYYQEAGRAGRDGSPADCLLLYSAQDVFTCEWLIENGENEYPDAETEKLLKERARARLRQMTSYCTTVDCLRGSILKYFGETPPQNCGNCGSCNGDFETADITIDAQKILSCVARMGERFGLRLLMDVLRGIPNEKVIANEFDKLSTFGILDKPVRELRQKITFLTHEKYLAQTNDQYPVIKLGPLSDDVLRRKVSVEMKIIKDREEAPDKSHGRANYGEELKRYRESRRAPHPLASKPFDKKLFEILRALRSDIAKELNFPAYIVFSDSTLTDMCVKTPRTRDEMLAVSGVGDVKFERYGEKFLEVIKNYLNDDDHTDNISQQDESSATSSSEYDAARVELIEEPATATMVADKINCVLLEIGRPRISALRINEWLISEGYMETVVVNDKNKKLPTAKGTAAGITTDDRVIRGEPVTLCLYNKSAQELIAQNALNVKASRSD